jgi:hypothetical protein
MDLHSLFNFKVFFLLGVFFLNLQFTVVNQLLFLKIEIVVGLNIARE